MSKVKWPIGHKFSRKLNFRGCFRMLTSGHFDTLMSEKCWVKQLSRLRAESARAVTGRRCPHSGEGEDFLPRQMGPLTKTVVTQKRNVKKSIRRCQNDRNTEGYNRPIDKNLGPIEKNKAFNAVLWFGESFISLENLLSVGRILPQCVFATWYRESVISPEFVINFYIVIGIGESFIKC